MWTEAWKCDFRCGKRLHPGGWWEKCSLRIAAAVKSIEIQGLEFPPYDVLHFYALVLCLIQGCDLILHYVSGPLNIHPVYPAVSPIEDGKLMVLLFAKKKNACTLGWSENHFF